MTQSIEFPRKKDYIFKSELGQGATGKTIVVYDPMIEEEFVCKKYSPYKGANKEELFEKFVNEIKLLHLLNHENIVRVFTYYLYRENYVGYIFMELVDGYDVDEYLAKNPEEINNVFEQIIEGFYYLEKNEILHRDIRPMNILVNYDGTVKIIDFGFGKQIAGKEDFDKSISLNWLFDPPKEFQNGVYNYTTEVYFIGKLIAEIISDNQINVFKYHDLLEKMNRKNPENRIESFLHVRRQLYSGELFNLDFTDSEKAIYQGFANNLIESIKKVNYDAKYTDKSFVENQLEECYKNVLLEDVLPDVTKVIRCFIKGTYYYKKHHSFPVSALKEFLTFFKKSNQEKKNIILSNIQTRLDALPRYSEADEIDDDLPF